MSGHPHDTDSLPKRWNACAEDPRPGLYYVTARDGVRTAYLAGPYDTHAAALDAVNPARKRLDYVEHHPHAPFLGYGTARLAPDYAGPLPPVRYGAPAPLDLWRETRAAMELDRG